jgi:hypothetical protein
MGGKIMGKHLILWSLNEAKIPVDPKERGSGYELLTAMVKQDIEKGIIKDYGTFPGEGKGYVVAEGTYLEIMKMAEQYVPYVQFEVHPAASLSEVDELIKHLTG